MKKLFLITAVALCFGTPVKADDAGCTATSQCNPAPIAAGLPGHNQYLKELRRHPEPADTSPNTIGPHYDGLTNGWVTY